MELKEKDSVRFFIRSGGHADISDGFSIGVSLEKPDTVLASEEVDGITFFVSHNDEWFFKDKELKVKYKRKIDEVEYSLSD